MCYQVTFLREGFAADSTLEGFFTRMDTLMNYQATSQREGFAADSTLKGFLPRMCSHV